ncbi:hypothetical protein HPP92_008409 [Vanilla planifolia]|uniref:RNA helicase n=1 Tax=Vanilla planifolia TaxID=51239 RepID=A0A835V5D1_VANPL|nr:hypothetical protein HPP92_008409 [Vanilla planifolia]
MIAQMLYNGEGRQQEATRKNRKWLTWRIRGQDGTKFTSDGMIGKGLEIDLFASDGFTSSANHLRFCIFITSTTLDEEDVVDNFRAGKTWVLIATDVMARGMDFKGVNCVINYDFPESAAAYIHRIGRSGRAGRPGEAITLFTEEDKPFLRNIANVMKDSGCEVPAWILALPKLRKKKHRPKRASVGAEPDESEG